MMNDLESTEVGTRGPRKLPAGVLAGHWRPSRPLDGPVGSL